MDIALPGMDGIVATRETLRRLPSARVIILSAHAQVHDVGGRARRRCHRVRAQVGSARDGAAGARRFRTRRSLSRAGVGDETDAGAHRESPRTGGVLGALSEREREMFRLAAECRTAVEIARDLCISRKTVDVHLNRINRKLALRDRAHLVRLAVGIGLVHSIRLPERGETGRRAGALNKTDGTTGSCVFAAVDGDSRIKTGVHSLPKPHPGTNIPAQPEGRMIRLVIVEDDEIVRDAIASLLRDVPDIEVVATASRIRDAWPLLDRHLAGRSARRSGTRRWERRGAGPLCRAPAEAARAHPDGPQRCIRGQRCPRARRGGIHAEIAGAERSPARDSHDRDGQHLCRAGGCPGARTAAVGRAGGSVRFTGRAHRAFASRARSLPPARGRVRHEATSRSACASA